MTKVIMHGCNGKMGQVITGLIAQDEDVKIVAGIDTYDEKKNDYPVYKTIRECQIAADVVIDFSNAKAVDELLNYCGEKKLPLVLCIGEHDLTHEGSGLVFIVGHHDDISRLRHVQCRMQEQVVSCPCLYCKSWPNPDAPKAAHQLDPGIHGTGAAHGICDVGGWQPGETVQ